MEFLNNHFNPLLSTFRSGFGCRTALLRIIEDWKKALDDNKFREIGIKTPEYFKALSMVDENGQERHGILVERIHDAGASLSTPNFGRSKTSPIFLELSVVQLGLW
jgi:hypothetical protein